jgi:uncharacterized membrane protein YphA (DoxX/SURF4 family)
VSGGTTLGTQDGAYDGARVGARLGIADGIALLARLILGGALLYAGLTKVGFPQASARAVQAYQILPFELAAYVGYVLPALEILIGGLLVIGLFSRPMAAAGTILMVIFIAGIASAWARGLSIDCGCFGGGGEVAAGQTAYPAEIARDVLFAACGLWVWLRGPGRLALDRLLAGRNHR